MFFLEAIIAMAHTLARLVYRRLKFGHHYVDQGIEYYEAKYRQQQLRWTAKQAAALNMQLVPLPELEVEFLEVLVHRLEPPVDHDQVNAPSVQEVDLRMANRVPAAQPGTALPWWHRVARSLWWGCNRCYTRLAQAHWRRE